MRPVFYGALACLALLGAYVAMYGWSL